MSSVYLPINEKQYRIHKTDYKQKYIKKFESLKKIRDVIVTIEFEDGEKLKVARSDKTPMTTEDVIKQFNLFK